MKRIICLIYLTLSLLTSTKLFAQSTLADLNGQIKAKDGTAIPGASITVRNESTGFTNRTQSNTKGVFTFKQLPLGGPYTITVSAMGFGSQKKQDYNLNQGDALQVNFDLESSVSNLEAVTITSTSNKKAIVNAGAATTITPTDISRLPVNGRNFANLAALSPLTGNGNSIGGQLGSGTNYTIDGMTAKNPTSAGPTTSRSGAPYSISIEAVREFKVVTNQYDVTLGRSGGGTVSAVTKSGTNTVSGSVFGYGRANWLSSPYDIRGNKRNNNYSTYQFGGSIGGPLIKDKLHYFLAWDHQTDNRSLVIADVRSASDELVYNVTRNVLDTFVDIARTKYGVSSHAQYGSFNKQRMSDAGFLRIDWQINDKNLLTIRNNYTNDVNKLGLIDNTAIDLYESTGNDYNRDNSLLLTLRSTISTKLTNELKAQHLYTWQSSEQNDELPGALPRAIVENVTSVLSDGSTKSTNIQIGGHRFGQENFTNNVFQLTDNLYYNTEKINYTFGIDLMYTHAKSLYGSEVNGRYVYRGMDAFRNNTPYAFYREVPLVADPSVVSTIFNGGIYGQLQTSLGKGVSLTAGLRFDMATYPKAPLNQDLYNALGLSTNNSIKSFVPQPRFQFTWDVQEKHTDYLKVGAGIFSSDINNYMLINNLTFDGKHFGTVNLNSSSVAIPSPDFSAFRKDLGTVPAFTQYQLPLINYTGPDAKIPVVYKANINYTKYITSRLRMGISAYLTYGRNNYFYIDKNMVETPYFTLPAEANRGVYIPLDKMNTSGGSGNYLDGRKSTAFGRVLELTSLGKNNTYTFVYDVNYRYYKDGNITASYTWNDSKDNTSYNGNVANSATLGLPVASDPRDLSKMSYSDAQFRHKVVFYGTSPTFAGFVFGVRFSGLGGTRYSLLSGVNSNQDFVSGTNDLAYVFDPNAATTPAAVRDGLLKLLNAGDAGFRKYVEKSTGKIAERNGGINGFYGTVDLRLAKQFKISRKSGFELSVDVFNFANMLNKKWGSSHNFGNTSLYRGTAFDKNTRAYTYAVNTSGVANPGGDPYQIQLGARFFF
ncbi:Carboxypeptidase regulatory-like domain-containing protein [Chitinophaga jiangningensis]|uniref:Carboxypeptidase regulatory-like domain-containing protein n=1 Tax=Chitinophaga jiangningensis TaxID=1419482 RepID=A0A1M7LU02_9BACT|nr:carboxypeptidase regulatory-like domain-containing protein [Chitinophaga jiangningensis]SHM81203.1 Carboxypeptidase regulatory-like domain-containing protein [Chitinophaga jiangningensis]